LFPAWPDVTRPPCFRSPTTNARARSSRTRWRDSTPSSPKVLTWNGWLVATKRRLFFVREMIADYRKLYDKSRGVTRAEVTSAAALTDANVASLKDSLRAASGGREVDLDMKVDPSIIGGLIVKLGSRMVDGSLKTKLNAIRLAMKEVG
jgi:ATP synthase delta (OSCP) subunit